MHPNKASTYASEGLIKAHIKPTIAIWLPPQTIKPFFFRILEYNISNNESTNSNFQLLKSLMTDIWCECSPFIWIMNIRGNLLLSLSPKTLNFCQQEISPTSQPFHLWFQPFPMYPFLQTIYTLYSFYPSLLKFNKKKKLLTPTSWNSILLQFFKSVKAFSFLVST